ncbi:multicopper oxidase family protein [Candidatus Thioglobus sp.]|uniref:multicopper oxidase family protein n=1 Tax=Candidatus Thioglobus sp. TaxID=2026721 RepID=UPI003D141D26
MINRRQFVQLILTLAILPKQLLQAKGFLSPNSFHVPPLELGKRLGKDVFFDLDIRSGMSMILPNKATPTLGINQNFLGVTLLANKGDRVHIKVKNNIHKTATLHWHGMKLPAKADGGPHQSISPKHTWLSEFDIIQDAATLWYHSHQMHETGSQVYHGLAGMFIISDDESKKLNLPDEYGVDDFPVIIQDKQFNRNGSFAYLSSMMDSMRGMKGNTILVNGVINPVLKAKKSLVRLRLLNGSNARTYQLSFNDNRAFSIIASDGGLLEKPVKANTIRLAAAERVEILVDVSDGAYPILRHTAIQESSGMGMMGMMRGMGNNDKNMNIFQIDASSALKSASSIPQILSKHDNPQQSEVTRQRKLVLQMQMEPRMMFGGDAFSINGKTMDINRIDEVVKAGSTEIWHLENASMMPHPLHIHNVQFKIIARKGGIKGHELGFKDVVLVHPQERVSVIMKFPEFRDAKTPYMYHCHILEHEDRGMMGQFVVV